VQDEANLAATQRLPPQAGPVMRTVVDSAVAGNEGVVPCDNEHTYFLYGLGFGRGKSMTGN
jgi:hypothetical protein